MRSTSTLALALAIAATSHAVTGQKACYDENPGIAPASTLLLIPAGLAAVRVAPQQNLTVTGLEWVGRAGSATSTGLTANVAVWDQDPVSGGPGTQIGSGTLEVQGDWGFYRAPLAAPVALSAGVTYFVSVQAGVTAFTPLMVRATTPGVIASEIWTNRTGTWSGPLRTASMGIRLHCGTHTGTFSTLGPGELNSLGATQLSGLGFPNLTNPVGYQLWNVAGGLPSAIVIGLPTAAPTLFGTLYVSPTIAGFSGTSGSSGSFSVTFSLPNDPSLTGVPLAAQGAVVDPFSSRPLGVALSSGVQMTIGD